MDKTNTYHIRPYARLLTMLGDQLISNERVALVELVKNSYDADASWVKISFNGFDADFDEENNLLRLEKKVTSSITIEDDGCGMTHDVIEKHWLNPATPEKKNKKKTEGITPKGRIIQGEKGIGRFAILKLGKRITITTRPQEPNDSLESVIRYDFSRFDEDFSDDQGRNLMLDELSVEVNERFPEHFVERNLPWGVVSRWAEAYGTLIEISDVKGEWNLQQIKAISHDLFYMQSIFDQKDEGELFIAAKSNSFDVKIFVNGIQLNENELQRGLNELIECNAVFKITDGLFDADSMKYLFKINGTNQSVDLRDDRITGYKIFRDYFGKDGGNLKKGLHCGPFRFEFYVFDFAAKPKTKYYLSSSEKETIRDHRVYLYRDGIRVYPYGDKQDDWLQIDILRGTVSAGMFLSNDQLVGCVRITQRDNPQLRDKTNREGLINCIASSDFVVLIQLFLLFVRNEFYRKTYRDLIKQQNISDTVRQKKVTNTFDKLQDLIKDNKPAVAALSQAKIAYKQEVAFMQKRVETTEQLAGVGLSVETTSHDIMAFLRKASNNIDGLVFDISNKNDINRESLLKELQSIQETLHFIENQLKGIQILFKSSKQRVRQLVVKEYLDKVSYIYRRTLQKEHIKIKTVITGQPLVAKTTDAVLLQTLINLFDNSIYWMQPMDDSSKTIEVLLDGNNGTMVFSDNGPGVREDDAPYIFEPFYSGKGEDGRGLGLYIARQLLDRHGYSIDLIDTSANKRLSGANFVISFKEQQKEESK